MPYENVDKHDELVNKLVEKIKKRLCCVSRKKSYKIRFTRSSRCVE